MPLVLPSRGLCPLSFSMTSGVYFSSVGYGWHLCATFSLFSRFWYGFFRLIFTLLLAPFQFFSILQVLVRGECGVCLHSAKLLLLFVLFRFPPFVWGSSRVYPQWGALRSNEQNKSGLRDTPGIFPAGSRRGRIPAGSGAVIVSAPHNTIHHTSFIWLLGSCALVHSCAPPTEFWCC